MGDLLTSWRMPTSVTLPTRPEYAVHTNANGFFASGLAQKLVIVRPYLMIAWAGSVEVARNLVIYLDEKLPKDREQFPGNENVLLSALNSLPSSVEVVALLIYKDTIQPLCVHAKGFEVDKRRIYLLGTGGEAFFNYILSAADAMPMPDNDEGFAARAVMVNFVGNAIMAQYSSKYGLSDSWGGGFEVAYAADDGFKKVENILVRCWSLNPDGGLGNIGTSFLVHYQGDALHLTTFGEHERTTIVQSWLDRPFIIPPEKTIAAEWSIDLFFRVTDGVRFCAVQKEFPWSRQRSEFHFRQGRLAGWEMDKSRVDQIIERIGKTDPTTDRFSLSTL
ncbi:hypothetical protein [Bradyrhizobium sp. CCGB01]|uniref:hypothetical protein n=1 Tax=Bradyrhizobium sp. CCGB01 TaxID=2949634 RepID=UPI0020B33FD0|nr:hypothetical protein [Bradyrhizobium sp. CCGB01]MCP3411571.1 hypothetical protein [Bradyrhizobium sp. CCGB01]